MQISMHNMHRELKLFPNRPADRLIGLRVLPNKLSLECYSSASISFPSSFPLLLSVSVSPPCLLPSLSPSFLPTLLPSFLVVST